MYSYVVIFFDFNQMCKVIKYISPSHEIDITKAFNVTAIIWYLKLILRKQSTCFYFHLGLDMQLNRLFAKLDKIIKSNRDK